MKYGIIGSRTFSDTELFKNILNKIFKEKGSPTVIISGGAKGADAMAEVYALNNKVSFQKYEPQFEIFPPNTRNYEAPKARNTEIAIHSDVLIAFWDMKSTGTKDTIDKSVAMGKKVYVYDFKNNFIYNIEIL